MNADQDRRSFAWVLGILALAVLLTGGSIAYDAAASQHARMNAGNPGTVYAVAPAPHDGLRPHPGLPLKVVIGQAVVAVAQLAD